MNFEPLFRHPVHAAIADAARYLQQLAPADALPKRQEFRPTRVPALLGFFFLVDVLADDYRFSLAGEHMTVLFGTDVTNKRLAEIGDNPQCARLKGTYDAVVESRSFHYVRGRYTWSDRSLQIERLLVPMADGEGRLRSILGVTIPHRPIEPLSLFAGIGAAMLEIDEVVTGAAAPAAA